MYSTSSDGQQLPQALSSVSSHLLLENPDFVADSVEQEYQTLSPLDTEYADFVLRSTQHDLTIGGRYINNPNQNNTRQQRLLHHRSFSAEVSKFDSYHGQKAELSSSYDMPASDLACHDVHSQLQQDSGSLNQGEDTNRGLARPNFDVIGASDPSEKVRCYDHGCNGRTFSSIHNYRRHLREKRGMTRIYYCYMCNTSFTRRSTKDSHISKGRCRARSFGQDMGMIDNTRIAWSADGDMIEDMGPYCFDNNLAAPYRN